jgi:hypothetical protein
MPGALRKSPNEQAVAHGRDVCERKFRNRMKPSFETSLVILRRRSRLQRNLQEAGRNPAYLRSSKLIHAVASQPKGLKRSKTLSQTVGPKTDSANSGRASETFELALLTAANMPNTECVHWRFRVNRSDESKLPSLVLTLDIRQERE